MDSNAENLPADDFSPKPLFSFWRVLLTGAILGGVCVFVLKWMETGIKERDEKESEKTATHLFGLSNPTPRNLDARFTDADGDRVADPPASIASRRSPDKLVISFVAGPDSKDQVADFKDFIARLSEATGKQIETAVFANIDEQLAAMTKGELHITAFNTGSVPAAVASAGFVPVCTFGGEDGSFGITMKIIVPAKSSIQKIEDLNGHTLTFTTLNSNSGFKAAVVLLQDKNMLPVRDYKWKLSSDHELSIKGIAAGDDEAAPVASDLLQRAISSGTIKPESIRVIYESERFPPATFGYVYDLSDDLAAKIRQTFLEFKPKETSLAKRFDDSHAARFVPVSYKQDFALIRRIDSRFQRQDAGK
jgi:phosphonate transport system substrate-binding protein